METRAAFGSQLKPRLTHKNGRRSSRQPMKISSPFSARRLFRLHRCLKLAWWLHRLHPSRQASPWPHWCNLKRSSRCQPATSFPLWNPKTRMCSSAAHLKFSEIGARKECPTSTIATTMLSLAATSSRQDNSISNKVRSCRCPALATRRTSFAATGSSLPSADLRISAGMRTHKRSSPLGQSWCTATNSKLTIVELSIRRWHAISALSACSDMNTGPWSSFTDTTTRLICTFWRPCTRAALTSQSSSRSTRQTSPSCPSSSRFTLNLIQLMRTPQMRLLRATLQRVKLSLNKRCWCSQRLQLTVETRLKNHLNSHFPDPDRLLILPRTKVQMRRAHAS